MLDLIRGARHSILVGSFLLTDGPASREVLEALVAKSREGVIVRVLGDTSSRFVEEEEAFSFLANAGVPTVEFNPPRIWHLFAPHRLLERDHRKYWVIDGRLLFLGGANLSDLSLIPPEEGGNRDLMVRLESPDAARELTRSFISTWKQSHPRLALPEEALLSDVSRRRGSETSAWFFNQESVSGEVSLTEAMFDGLFASAQKTVWLVEPYTFTEARILDSVRAMTARGVVVHIVLSSRVRAPRFHYASFYGIQDLLEAGARVWIFDSEISPLHYKCAVIDDRLAYVGSANLNHRSLRLSRELSLVFEDPPGVKAITEVIGSVRKNAREVTREEAAHYRGLPFLTWWLIMQSAG